MRCASRDPAAMLLAAAKKAGLHPSPAPVRLREVRELRKGIQLIPFPHSDRPPKGRSASRRSFSRQTSAASSSNSGLRENSQRNQLDVTKTGSSSKATSWRDRGQGRPLGADPRARQASGAEASPSRVPGRLSCGATGAETPLRCAVTLTPGSRLRGAQPSSSATPLPDATP